MACNRHSELALLLQSLRTQTYQNFDIMILDDGSGTSISTCHFLNCILIQLKMEGHGVKTIRNNQSNGVCFARNLLIENDTWNNEFTARIDDDCILESDYLERLIRVIDQGYDLASGVTPNMFQPIIERSTEFIKPIINELRLNEKGEIEKFGDDCGYGYIEDEIIPTHHFRSNCLYKSKINKEIKYELGLSRVGFREESFFSIRMLWKGYKMAVDTKAIAWHIRTPSGGCRAPNYNELVQLDDNTFKLWVKRFYKKYGDPVKNGKN